MTDAGPNGMNPDGTNTSGRGSGGSGGGNTNNGGTAGSKGGSGSTDMPLPEYEGIPTDAIVYGKAPGNCTSKGTNDGNTLVLPLDNTVKGLLLSGKNGALQANGVTCTGVAAPSAVKITGTGSAETVIVDLSIGELPESLQGATITVDLGGAKDTFALATTREDDEVRLGTMGGAALVWTGEGQPLLKISNQELLVVSSGPGNDIIDATGSADVGAALSSALTVFGGAGDDALQGGGGADALHGGEGDDNFKTAAAADGGDVYDGGPGLDTLSYENRTNPLTIKVDKMANDGEVMEKDDVQGTIETIIGGSAADSITGGDADETFIGGPGNDTLNGGAGDDTFMEPTEQQGADVMNGGPGSDTVDYSERPTALDVTLCIPAQASCVTGICGCGGDDGEANEKDALVNVENVIGGRGSDRIIGSASDNMLYGNEGDDELRSEAGDDTLYGGDGSDRLTGGAGDDLLSGDNGTDTIDGGDGQGDICIVVGSELPLNCELH